MGHRSIQKYLYDIQQSILSIEEYLGEKRDFIAYEQNKLLRRAVDVMACMLQNFGDKRACRRFSV